MTKTRHELDADVGRMLREVMGNSRDGKLEWNNWITEKPYVKLYTYLGPDGGFVTKKALAITVSEVLEKVLGEVKECPEKR